MTTLLATAALLSGLPAMAATSLTLAVAFLALVILLVGLTTGKRTRAARTSERSASQDGARQALRDSEVKAVQIMSREQLGVDRVIRCHLSGRGLHVNPEVSLSAVFRVTNPGNPKDAYRAFASIRQKYVDFLITDADHRPICGVEYHGSGHNSGNAARRDAAKAEAFSQAGLPLIVVSKGFDANDLGRQIDIAVGTRHGRPASRRRSATGYPDSVGVAAE
ncbi:DUF2726 domain-containing protein [uncultured Jannaschia sp.]|uniref:DUF2726 domain-containing protein n=1 Tax=uncultured Jannaschia sp. TaxID=293347 RepID=UPI002610318E|nr:DUF2726 domain-containing protein [uncultured Jannaschia sp.]